jgi:hypothetical protein
MKTVDKYQFNEETPIIEDGGTFLTYIVLTFNALHTVLKKKFLLKMATFG